MTDRLSFDKIFALFCILLAILVGIATAELEKPAGFQQIGAALWPNVLAVALAFVGVGIWLESRKNDLLATPVPAQEDDDAPGGLAAWIVAVALVLSAPIMMYFGYWVAGSFLMLVVACLRELPGHYMRSILFGIYLPGAVFLLFTRVFSQFLPVGFLFE